MDKPHFDHYNQSAPEYVEQILWHRIVATVVIAIVIVAGSAWAAYELLKEPDENNLIAPAVGDTSESQDAAEDGATGTNLAQAENSHQISGTAHSEPESVNSTPVPKTTPSESITPVESAQDSVIAVATTATAAEPNPESNTAPAAVAAGSYQVSTRIQNNDIAQAVLADEMENLEPKTKLESTAGLTAPFVKLYFYTDLNGRAGDRLTYTWSRNGEVAAQVRIGVGSDRWRSHSSKNINQSMRGDWQVVVTDKQGQTLASSHFVMPEADTTHP